MNDDDHKQINTTDQPSDQTAEPTTTAIVEEAGLLEPAGHLASDSAKSAQSAEPADQQASETAESTEPEESGQADTTDLTETPNSETADESVEEEAADTPIDETPDSPETPTDEVGAAEADDLTEVAETPEPTDTADQADSADSADTPAVADTAETPGRWYVVHTFSGHENKVATNLKQRIESEHLENRIFDILVPTQDKIEIRGGKKEQVKEKIFPGYILVKMLLDDQAWLAVRTTQGVTAFVGMNNRPTPISEREVQSIVKFMTQGAPATFKDVFLVDDTVKIIDGPFADFIGKIESVDKEKGKVRVLVSIFGRETPVELDFLQVTKL